MTSTPWNDKHHTADADRGKGKDHGGADRGRHASSPTQIPAPGWKDILFRTYKDLGEDRTTLIAAAATYYTLLALFPALTALVSIYGLFTDPASVRDHISGLSSVVPQSGMQIITDQLTRLTENGGTTLGFALIISLGLALWSASSGVKTMFEAMNIAYGEHEKRNFFVLNGMALLFTLGGIVAALLLIGVAVILPGVLGFIGLGGGLAWLVQVGSYVALVLVMLTGIAVLYRWGPSRQQARWRWITPGAVFATVAIIIMSVLFSWYAANFAHYDKTYGSLGGLIGLLTWMWLSITALMIGAELNAETERQTRKDSTIGGDDPMGARRATAADTVGATTGHDDGSKKPGPEFEGKSREWQEGYAAAMAAHARPRASWKAVGLALPVAVALEAAKRKRSD